jgi:hypothetical protein
MLLLTYVAKAIKPRNEVKSLLLCGVAVLFNLLFFYSQLCNWFTSLIITLTFIFFLSRFINDHVETIVVSHLEAKWRYHYSRFWMLVGQTGDNLFLALFVPTALTVSVIMGYKMMRFFLYGVKTYMGKSEASDERMNLSAKLSNYERISGCGKSYERLPNKIHDIWNVKIPDIKGTDFTNRLEDLYKRSMHNVRAARITFGLNKIPRRTFIFGLKGNYALINTHAFSGEKSVILQCSPLRGDIQMTSVFTETHITALNRIDLGDDLTLIKLDGINFLDITGQLCDIDNMSTELSGYGFDKHLDFTYQKFLTMEDKEEVIIINDVVHYPLSEHAPGLCGLPLIGDFGKYKAIFAIHAAGTDMDGGRGFAKILSKTRLLEAIVILEKTGLIGAVSQSCEEIHENPVPASMVHYEILHGVDYFGKLPGSINMNQVSKVERTPYSNDMEEVLSKYLPPKTQTFGPPLMTRVGKGDTYLNPYNIAMKKIAGQKQPLSHVVLNKIVNILVDRISSQLAGRKLAPLDFQTAINGIDYDTYTRHINVKTAGGHNFPGKKSDYMPLVEECEYHMRTMNGTLQDSVEEVINAYAKELSLGVIYKGCLKDEPRPIEKITSGKTRLFFSAPVDNLIVARMYLGPFYTLMQEYRQTFCTAIGINIHSEAKEIYDSLHETYNMEGDYSNYDQGMPIAIGTAACTVVYRLLKAFGYNEFSLNIVKGLLSDNMFPQISVLQDHFRCPGLQPSGKYGTAEDNSLRGLILLMYCWYSMPETRDLDFFDHVRPTTYGDDLIASITPAIKDKFNNVIYAEFCKRFYGITYTPASKGNVLLPFVSRDQISFLKRRFLVRGGNYYAPLDHNSLYKTAMWRIPSDSVDAATQAKGTFASLAYEMFLHLNRGQYNSWRDEVLVLKSEHRDLRKIDIPPYDKIYNNIFGPCDMVVRPEDNPSSFLDIEGIPVPSVESYDEDVLINIGYKGMAKWRASPRILSSHTKHITLISQLNELRSAKLIEIDLCTKELMEFKELSNLSDSNIRQMILSTFNKKSLDTFYRVLSLRAQIEESEETIKVIDRRISELRVLAESANDIGVSNEGVLTRLKEHQNLLDAAGDTPSIVNIMDSVPINQGEQELSDLGDYLNRPIRIWSGNAAFGSDFTLALDIWNLFAQTPSVRAKLRNYAYFRGNLNVKVAISGTPQDAGRIMVSYQPYAKANLTLQNLLAIQALGSAFRPLLNNYLSQAQGSIMMNINENKPMEMTLPFISPKAMFRLFNSNSTGVIGASTNLTDFDQAGQLFLTSVGPLSSIVATSTDVSIQIYAWMENVQLGTNTATQMVVTTESKDEMDIGPVQSVATSLVSVSKLASNVPELAPYAKASELVFSGVGKLAALLGWSKPVISQNAVQVKNQPFQNGAQLIGSETLKRITLDPKQELEVSPSVGGVMEDEMVISHMASRMSYLTTVEWPASATPMVTPIWYNKNTPLLASCAASSPTRIYNQPTAACFATMPFEFWRADIVYKIDVICSKFHRGKFAVIFEPNIGQSVLINSSLSFNKQYIKVIDIQDTQTVEFVVKWAQPREWCISNVKEDIHKVTNQTYTTNWENCYNGYITIVPFTQIQSPDGSGVFLNISTCARDLQVNGLSQDNVILYRNASFESADEDITTQEVTSLVLNNSTASTAGIALRHFGEQPLSFRSLLKRYVTSNSWTVNALASTIRLYQFAAPNIPINALKYTTTNISYVTLFDYLRYAFLGMRGSMRYRYHTNTPFINGGHASMVKASLVYSNSDSSGGTAVANGVPNAVATNLLIGTVAFIPTTNGGIEFEVPYYSGNLFTFSCNDHGFGTAAGASTNDGNMQEFWFRQHTIAFEGIGSNTDAMLAQDCAVGEDFIFIRYLGAPYFVVAA